MRHVQVRSLLALVLLASPGCSEIFGLDATVYYGISGGSGGSSGASVSVGSGGTSASSSSSSVMTSTSSSGAGGSGCTYHHLEESPDYSLLNCGGGIVMCINGSFDASGMLTAWVVKCDNSTFASGDFYLYQFNPNDGDPSGHCTWTNERVGTYHAFGDETILTFPPVSSGLVCGGPQVAYCVGKAATNGNDAWFCSDELLVSYVHG
jgi:hypothetical protein